MSRSSIPQLLLATLVAGCSVTATDFPSASAEPSRSVGDRRPLSSGFPVMPAAVSVPMPQDDPGLIGLWESDQVGSTTYDFYVTALPAAGYPIVGLYPGGEVAVIRFRVPEGEVWQMVARGTPDGRVAIEIRLDRP